MIFTILSLLPLLCLCDFDQEDFIPSNSKLELDKLTRLLCEAGKIFRGKKKGPSKELAAWWEDHQKKDAKKK